MARFSHRAGLGIAAAIGLATALVTRGIVRLARRPDLTGRVVIVTGGSRGLGILLAREFGRRGARVAICGRDALALADAEKKLQEDGVEVLAVPCDLGDREEARRFVEQVVTTWGRIDVLANNAGTIRVSPALTTTLDDIEEAMRSNFWSAANTTAFALPHLQEQRSGARIVNIVSIGGRVAAPHLLGYTVSKFALMGFSEDLREELLRSGIKVTTVIPGLMRTGSIYNAEFSGNARREFEWFSLLGSLPVVSISAERAARAIVNATLDGRSVVHLGFSAAVLSLLHGIAPQLVMRMMAGVNRALPAPTGPGDVWKGREIASPLVGSPLLRLANAAARRNNEAPPEGAR